ncbi:glycoside hydrolase family 16 protein [Peziza echinospora]|nr:glycoside hydrolase family 16 protein [Peziza echinospora]
MQLPSFSTSTGLLGLVLSLARLVSADCECGYSVNATTDQKYQVFTELLESDFTRSQNIKKDTDWVLQNWKIDKNASHGPYGRQTLPSNVVSNPLKDINGDDIGKDGTQSGLQLYVRKLAPGSDLVSVSEVDSRRSDMIYGSYRAGLKTTGINGTCGAFFWYLNDTQEIDMEFLSSQLNDTTSPVNLVLHSPLSLQNGGDASGTPTFKVIQLPFEADEQVHEYRFDWTPGKVSFYADGKWLYDMTEFVPTTPGHIVLSHWSNGNHDWSAGPPEVDAKLLVQYVKAYFNSSSKTRGQDYKDRCKDPKAENAICQIPDQKGAPLVGKNAGSQLPFFFYQQKNKTIGQYVSAEINDATSLLRGGISGALVAAVAVAVLADWL